MFGEGRREGGGGGKGRTAPPILPRRFSLSAERTRFERSRNKQSRARPIVSLILQNSNDYYSRQSMYDYRVLLIRFSVKCAPRMKMKFTSYFARTGECSRELNYYSKSFETYTTREVRRESVRARKQRDSFILITTAETPSPLPSPPRARHLFEISQLCIIFVDRSGEGGTSAGIFAADVRINEKSSFVVIKVITRLPGRGGRVGERLKLPSHVPYIRPYIVAITRTGRE